MDHFAAKRPRCPIACASALLALLMSTVAWGTVTSVEIADDRETLVSVELDRTGDGRADVTVPADNLARGTISFARQVGAIWAPQDDPPEIGQPAAYLFDDSLRTGIESPGFLRVEFDQPIPNGPGPELILIDLGSPDHQITTVQNHRIARLSVTIGTDATQPSPEVRWAQDVGSERLAAIDTWDELDGEISDVDELRNGVFIDVPQHNVGAGRGLPVNAAAIDLSDLGYDQGEMVRGLHIEIQQFAGLDLMFVGAVARPGAGN